MFKFCSLYSGSTGNSLFVETDNTKVLVDTGESCKKIVEGLSSINVSADEIDAIIITHEYQKSSIYQYMQIQKLGMQCQPKEIK